MSLKILAKIAAILFCSDSARVLYIVYMCLKCKLFMKSLNKIPVGDRIYKIVQLKVFHLLIG